MGDWKQVTFYSNSSAATIKKECIGYNFTKNANHSWITVQKNPFARNSIANLIANPSGVTNCTPSMASHKFNVDQILSSLDDGIPSHVEVEEEDYYTAFNLYLWLLVVAVYTPLQFYQWFLFGTYDKKTFRGILILFYKTTIEFLVRFPLDGTCDRVSPCGSACNFIIVPSLTPQFLDMVATFTAALATYFGVLFFGFQMSKDWKLKCRGNFVKRDTYGWFFVILILTLWLFYAMVVPIAIVSTDAVFGKARRYRNSLKSALNTLTISLSMFKDTPCPYSFAYYAKLASSCHFVSQLLKLVVGRLARTVYGDKYGKPGFSFTARRLELRASAYRQSISE